MLTFFFIIVFIAELIIVCSLISWILKLDKKVCELNECFSVINPIIEDTITSVRISINSAALTLNKIQIKIAQKKDKYKQQKDKLKWLLNDINNPKSKRNPRRANQTDYYKSLLDKEENREIQGIIELSRSKQGFLVQVLKLQERHNDNKKIDIETWL